MTKFNKNYDDFMEFVQDFDPTFHLTLQWDKNHRTRDIPTLEKRLHYFMSRVQREILGRKWYRHHIPFIAFGETNAAGEYHIHILLKGQTYTQECWEVAFRKIALRAKRTPVPKAPYLQGIIPGTAVIVARYDAKQLRSYKFCDSVVITSEYLFYWKKRGKQWKGRIL